MVLGAEHPLTLTSMHDLASMLHATGRLREAEHHFQAALNTCTRVLVSQAGRA